MVARRTELKHGFVLLYDEQDEALVLSRLWHAHQSNDGRAVYARSKPHQGQAVFLHNLILPPPEGMVVDHRDGNGLNNCRSNLRHATQAENLRNRRLYRNNQSGFKGVSKCGDRWRARLYVGRKQFSGGLHETAEQAARAYDLLATAHHGEFRRLNLEQEQ